MRFEYHLESSAPRLAWCLRINRGDPAACCVHGSWVETRPDYFAEGGWDGGLEDGRLMGNSILMGSGAIIEEDCFTVCTPSHVMECVYSMPDGEHSLLFSNSLVFLLAAAREEPDPGYMDYEGDILSITKGIRRYERFIPTLSGRKVQLHYYCNIRVDAALQTCSADKPACADFPDFESYHQFLLSTAAALQSNLSDPRRRKKFAPLVFCSSGYDSAACAVIAREIGCGEAVVFESRKGLRSDSGFPIVKSLGYDGIHEKQETDYLKQDVAEEFVSSGELGTAIFYAAAAAELEGRNLLSGDYGDDVWERCDKNRNAEFARLRTLPNTAMKEFRLRVGFVRSIVPAFGADRIFSIEKISNSTDMVPWRLNGDYDKPIPRRIVESAGIPRGSFAVRKDGGVGNSLRFLGLSHLKKVMPPGSFQDFRGYFEQHRRYRSLSPDYVRRSLLYLSFLDLICLAKVMLNTNLNLIKADRMFPEKSWHRISCSPWAPSLLFCWGVSRVSGRYAEAGELMRSLAPGTQRS